MSEILAKIQMRFGTADVWTLANTLLLECEFGVESNTGKMKKGDGVTRWNDLDYYSDPIVLAMIAAYISSNNAALATEIAARIAADSAEATTRANAVSAEATTREAADTTLQNNINAKEASANKVTTLSGANNTTFPTTQAVDEAIQQAVTSIVSGAPNALDTLLELSAALGNDADFATHVTNYLAGKVDKVTGKGLSTEDYTTAEKTKLSSIAEAATANSTDAQLRDRSTHSGTQAATTITEDSTHRFATDAEKTTWNGKQDALGYTPLNSSDASVTNSRFWITVPGTPVRVGNTSFTITDTSNANLYDMLLGRTTVLKWTDTGVTKMAMIVSATYSANAVTVTIVGDTLASSATMNTFKYATEKCRPVVFGVAGTIAATTNITSLYHAPCAMKVFGVDGYHGTAGSTGATTYDINKDTGSGAVTMFTTKLSIASGAKTGLGYTADSGTELAATDIVSIDCDSISTTAPVDAYIHLFVFPLKTQYLN